jgi:hypothetical protein
MFAVAVVVVVVFVFVVVYAVALFGTLHSLLPMFAVEGAVDEKIDLVTPVVDATGVDVDEKID